MKKKKSFTVTVDNGVENRVTRFRKELENYLVLKRYIFSPSMHTALERFCYSAWLEETKKKLGMDVFPFYERKVAEFLTIYVKEV